MILRTNAHEYGELMANEIGKPVDQGIQEVKKCAWCCEYYIQNTPLMLKDELVKKIIFFRHTWICKYQDSSHKMNLDILTLLGRTFPKLAEIHFHLDITSNFFLVILIAICIATLMLGRLYAMIADKNSRGFIPCFIGYWLPILFFAIGFTLSDYYLSDYIQDPINRLAINYIISGPSVPGCPIIFCTFIHRYRHI